MPSSTGYYSATDPTLQEGQVMQDRLDINGFLRSREAYVPVAEDNTNGIIATLDKPLAVATYNATAYDIITAANAGVMKASAGNLYKAWFTNSNAAVQIYALLNKATTPVNGDTPIMYFRIPATTTFLLEYRFGKRFSTGIAWAQVTTVAATITLAGTTDTVVSAEVA